MDGDASSASYIQAERILRIETPLGADVLLPEHVEMREAVNDLFTLIVAVRSKKTDIKPDEIVGKLVDVSLELGQGERRTWNGLVVRLVEGPPVTRGLRAYQLEIRPQHWLMSQRSDCRIWQDKTSLDVARTLLSEHKLQAPVTSGVIPEPKPQHYSVQYNETDIAYLLRRLEEDGLFFWFGHEGGSAGSVAAKHVMHIASHVSGYTSGPETDVRLAMGSSDRNHLTKFERSFTYVPGKRSAGDWNFLTPGSVPSGETPSLVSLPGNEAYELYEYPMVGGYGSDSASEGIANDRVERQSKLRMQAAEADYERIEGASSIRTLSPGRRFKPYDVANPGNSYEEHVTFQIVHVARDRSYETNEGEPDYSNRFIALPSRVPATPHRSTQRPRIDGTDIAIIAGPPGEEIHPDKYGRVKVWFPWDRRAKKDGTDTCWIRVAQNWGGGNWGGQIIPRVGMEAIVSYLGGDPDRPIITALVPNASQQVPYQLPEHKTKSIFRSNTYKSKDPTKFNEFSFEDAPGQENFHLHAQKDMTSKVLNNQIHTVDASALHSYGQQHQLTVGANMNHQVGGGLNQVVGATTGAGAAALLAPLAGLMGQSAGMLQQAMAIAAQAAASQPGSAASKTAGAAASAVTQAALGGLGGRSSSGGGAPAAGGGGEASPGGILSTPPFAPPADAGGQGGVTGGIASALASSVLGVASGLFDQGLKAAANVAPQALFLAGGAPMATAGTAALGTLGGLLGGGVLSQTIGQMQVKNVGVASSEQIGTAKVSTVGQVSMEKVGHTKRVRVGEELLVEVGGNDGKEPKSVFLMKSDGTILIKGIRIYVEGDTHIQLITPMQDNN
ncbi:type VI secretion system tip protein TssI/VgrG [Labrys neptuniae]|uniref:type VI secretion system tip protein TssI/VgrG n=1 Tax=Labrys neptuniae TaxID=376174 RepID=UPI0028925D09|nr:type VI secretion system tip protein TssI/VgrG [Labrys neptuniae]MDT3376341.1 type VI secretion system tip protein TssI/VgrG [Labrys neptuniae]